MNALLIPIALAVVWAVLLWLLPVMVAGRILHEKHYPGGWLAFGLIPLSGLPLMGLAMLLPDRSPNAAAKPRSLAQPSNLAGLGLLGTCLVAGVVRAGLPVLAQLSGPAPVPGLNDPQVTAALQQRFAELPLFQSQRDELGVPEVVSVSEVMFEPGTRRRMGRAMLRHRQGEETVYFSVRPGAQRGAAPKIEVDPLPLPPVNAPRVAALLRRAVSSTPRFQARSLRDEQWKLSNITELSSSADGMQRNGVLTLQYPEGEEDLRFQVTLRNQILGQIVAQIVEPELPKLKSTDVELALLQVLEVAPMFRSDNTAATHPELMLVEEVSFDPLQEQRKGLATVKAKGSIRQVPFTLTWRDRNRGQFRISLDQPELPPVDAPEVALNLRQLIESSPVWQAYREHLGTSEILRATETGADTEGQWRRGRARVRHRQGTDEIEFTVHWLDQAQGMFGVAILPPKSPLPMVESQVVAERLRTYLSEVIAQHSGGKEEPRVEISQVTQLSYDETEQRRFGRARVRPGKESDEVEVDFMIYWSDQAQSCWGMQMKSPEIPRFDTKLVRHEIKHAIIDSQRFAKRLEEVGQLEVDSATEVAFDTTEQKRVGRAQVKHALGSEVVRFAIRWNDPARGIWEVQVLDD